MLGSCCALRPDTAITQPHPVLTKTYGGTAEFGTLEETRGQAYLKPIKNIRTRDGAHLFLRAHTKEKGPW